MVMTVFGAEVPLGSEPKVWITGSLMYVTAGHV
jgi:hypothetical protein